MSMMGAGSPGGREEVGQTVAEFPTYEGAQKAVSALIAGDVPARDIAIVGQGLRSIERITGRLGYATAARSGAVNGVLFGLLFSAFFVLGTPAAPIQAFIGVMFIGIAVGMLLSIVLFTIVRRRRDFASMMQVVAERYEVTVADSSVHRARQVLGRSGPVPPPTVRAPAAAPVAPPTRPVADPAEPPRYGERLPPQGSPQPAPPVPGEQIPGEPRPGAEPPTGEEPAPGPQPPTGGDPAPGPSVDPHPTPPVQPDPGPSIPVSPGRGDEPRPL